MTATLSIPRSRASVFARCGIAGLLATSSPVFSHDLSGGLQHSGNDQVAVTTSLPAQINNGSAHGAGKPAQAASFESFSPRVKLRWDEAFLYVESNGLPAHGMMAGIIAWQQQVPLPQSYAGENAWRIPLHPVVAKESVSIKGRFLRGAIAVAANGIPIFNPQNHRGEISQEIGELDQWGGHCGRADDYHYHAAPLHLESTLGKAKPIAYALDGYPIYGLVEPDGSPTGKLDDCAGHTTSALGYHYHASTEYPYVNGGFHGEVVEKEGQVDPQPRAQSVRQDLPPMRGAKITGFTASPDEKNFSLQYTVNRATGSVNYSSLGNGAWKFQFAATDGTKSEENYRASERGGGGNRPGRRNGAAPRDKNPQQKEQRENRPPREDSRTNSASIAVPKKSGSFVLRSPEVGDGGALPVDYTGDGASSTLPLEWSGAPAATKSYALIMHHLDPEGKTKVYWTLYNIPASVQGLPKNTRDIGTLGNNTINDRVGYAPPHSKGPGAKTYILTLYALSSVPKFSGPASHVTGEALSAAIRDSTLSSTELSVVYTRGGTIGDKEHGGQKPPMRNDGIAGNSAKPIRGGNNPSAIVKPEITDTIKVNVYADNWFVLYINGKPVAVDPIDFLPHNVVTLDILPEYPMTIAIMAKDNADPKTGMEYGNHIGDGGFIIKFADGTVSNATWKAKSFFRGPHNHETINPQMVQIPLPANWFAVDFDDSKWANAMEFTEQRVNPKPPYYNADFKGAKFIWTADLDLDNTVVFRTKIEKPGWQKRWNTKPDLDVKNVR